MDDYISAFKSMMIKQKDSGAEVERQLSIGIPGGANDLTNQFSGWIKE